MKTIPWDLRFGLASSGVSRGYLPPLPLPPRARKERPVYQQKQIPAAMQQQTRTILRRVFLGTAILILAAMGYLMHVPLKAPVESIVKLGIPYFDKIVHFTLYFLLSLALCGWLWVGRVPVLKQVFLVIVLMMGYSALEEWSQQFSPGRNCDVYDWFADVSGFTLGCVMTWSLVQWGPQTLRITEQQPA